MPGPEHAAETLAVEAAKHMAWRVLCPGSAGVCIASVSRHVPACCMLRAVALAVRSKAARQVACCMWRGRGAALRSYYGGGP